MVGELPLASPELALVDATLAAELRRSLRPVEDSWLRPRASSKDAPAVLEDAPVQRDFADELGETESGDSEHFSDDEYIGESESAQESSCA